VVDLPAVHCGLEEAGYSDQEIDASSLTHDKRLAGRLIGPIRDRFGRILSFWARDPFDRPPKFLFKGPWREEVPLVGLDTALAPAGTDARHPDILLVFERLFDALALHGMGFTQAAAIAGPASDMAPARWERLAALGVRRVILVPDDSQSSRQNAVTAVENAFRADPAPAVWVLPPEAFRPHPTGLAMARARGLCEFQSLLQTRAVNGHHYRALPVENLAPRPSIPRPTVMPFHSQEGLTRPDVVVSPHVAREITGTLLRHRTSRTGVGSHCPIHDCDTTVCFCFD
jgi:hypothetical protein